MATSVARSGTGPRGRLPHPEHHRTQRVGWLRAAVLGANDGIVSTASLIVGVAAADTSRPTILTAGVAGLVAGAMSMAVGEFVSVSSQRDAEQADLAQERRELAADPVSELNELTRIYERRGLDAAAGRRGGPPAHPPRCPRRPRPRRARDHRRGRSPVRSRRRGRRPPRSPSAPWSRCWRRWPARRRHGSSSSPPPPSSPWPRSAPSAPASVAPRCGAAAVRITVLGALAMADHGGDRGGVGTAVGLMSP